LPFNKSGSKGYQTMKKSWIDTKHTSTTFSSKKHMSITESEMYSHDIILDIALKSKTYFDNRLTKVCESQNK
jgi:hypothetical protein